MSRGSGGKISKAIAWVKDSYNQHASGAEFSRDEWFALYPNDWNIDDTLWIEGVKREHFRLHPGVLSDGCITLVSNAEFRTLRNALLATTLIDVPCMKDLKAYGMIEVVNNGYNTCP
ncbi:tlde1 domain-containing protein [Klebsiella sp. R445]